MLQIIILGFGIMFSAITVMSFVEAITEAIYNKIDINPGHTLTALVISTVFWCIFYYLTH